MRVLVTGASGFLGAHCAAELVKQGHTVVALVRNAQKLRRALEPLGAPEVAVAHGDVTDADAVARAMDGVDAVLHAAAVYSLDPRRAQEMEATNVNGTRLVLAAAHARGLDPVVHVSSVVALLPLPKRNPPKDPPLGTGRGPYVRSKRESEALARADQARGLPVVITHPGHIFGPHDPGPGEMVGLLRAFLGNVYPFWMPGAGMTVSDVAWLARAHAGLFVRGQGPRLIPMHGHYLPWSDMLAMLGRLTGRWLPPALPAPKPMALTMGWFADVLRATTGVDIPFSMERSRAAFILGETDISRAVALAGPPPPAEQSLTEAMTWAAAQGHLAPRLLGRLARQALPAAGG